MGKETFEWIHSWCDYAENNELPRILLIGDSICCGYQELVRTKLKGICYVDYIATSYSCDNPIYKQLIMNFVKNSKYDLIHFNHGLHGKWITDRTYASRMKKLISDMMKESKVAICETTSVNKENTFKQDASWKKKVTNRNNIMHQIASDNGLKVDCIYQLSIDMPHENRLTDGFHYQNSGYELFAEVIVNFIKNNL